jgi:hypothetical protein
MKTSVKIKCLLFTTMISSILFLSSCSVAYRTPHHRRTGVVIETYDNNRHDNGLHKGQYKHRGNDDRQ